jgi:acetoin utilization deacetylase AcuC-like enzyme
MDPLVLFYPQGHEAHAEAGHPERPERVEAIREAFEEAGWWEAFPRLDPLEVNEEVLSSIHAPDYLRRLKEVSRSGARYDMDTYTTPQSWELALQAAGGAQAVARAVWRREARRGFALTRPPGHHATPERAMGFCLLNNVALAAEYLLRVASAQRLAIVDLDLHHGNGTQDIFYRRADVFYISTHQSPLYPGTGDLAETGYGEGRGATANFPLPPFSGDKAFKTVMDELILPLLIRHHPQMLLVSYGFDTHWRDPLGNLQLSAGAYGELVALLASWADQFCDGRIAIFLEGGYDLQAAKACSQAVLAAMIAEPWQDPLGPSPQREGNQWQSTVQRAMQIWNLQ